MKRLSLVHSRVIRSVVVRSVERKRSNVQSRRARALRPGLEFISLFFSTRIYYFEIQYYSTL